MTNVRAAVLAGLAAALFAAPCAAQQERPDPLPDGDSIVVTGQTEKPPRREVDRQAREITHSGGDELHRPLARIEDRLCPGVAGLKVDAASLMVERIRWQGERLGLWMAPEDDCEPNLIVAIVEDGQAELATLHDKYPWLFQSLPIDEREALLAEQGPVRVWTRTVTRNADGIALARRENLTDPPVTQANAYHSKIYLNIREDISQVVVLLDRRGVMGKTLIQLADYATIRGFARTKPVGADAALDTILTLFDPGAEPPSGLTDFDQAYLRSLYEGIPNINARTKILGVNRELGQLLDEDPDDE
jgi:hypothetical protein